MKKFILIGCALFYGVMTTFGQTASNFNCNDCAGTNHDLFTDLNAGNVVVIVWVMPCASCINGALSAQTEVQNALAANPGKVKYYLADDAGNTNCNTLTSWANTNGITSAVVISNSNVDMSAYGEAGMPKIVVIGGGSAHKVFYNQNAPDITSNGIKDAITAAFAAPTGINENRKDDFSVKVYPNPGASVCNVSINLLKESEIKVEVYNQLGQVVQKVFKGSLNSGSHNFDLNTSGLVNGNYFVSFSDGTRTIQEKLIVNH